MNCAEGLGQVQDITQGISEGKASLIDGCFAFNHSEEYSLFLSLRKDSLVITTPLPTNFSHPTLFPITLDLTYRIVSPERSFSENSFWLLKLCDGKAQLTLKSNDLGSLERWRDLMRKHVSKLGFWDDYKPVRKISNGSGSAVYEVRRVEDGKKFAVKAFSKAQIQQNKKFQQALVKEIKVLREVGQLKHAHLLGIQEVYSSESAYYLVMELCGRDLLRGGKIGPASRTEKVRQAMRQLLSGLAVLHQHGLIHRDIKPNNIMFRQDKYQLVITDFGLATYLGENHPFVRCGTPGFVAPEVFELEANGKLSNFASDIFSMGVVFHILLTGEHLFNAENAKEIFIKNSKMEFDLTHQSYQNFDQSSINLLQKMLIIDPSQRITAKQALKHQYFTHLQTKLKSPAPTFQSYNRLANNQQQFSQIEIGIMGRKRHKGQYRKASQQ